MQLDEFVDVASESFPGIDRIRQEWEALLGYLAEQDAVVVLDEFPYLIDADESLPSIIQRLWDQEIQDTAGTLVLVGSSISMMEEATLLGNSPLYGRFTEKIDLRQLNFDAAREFFPESYTPEEQVFAWGVFGGTPYYLHGVELDHDLGSVVQRSILSQQGFLHNEPEYVLRTELTEPNRYFAILKRSPPGTRPRTRSRGRSVSTGSRFRRTPRNWNGFDWSNARSQSPRTRRSRGGGGTESSIPCSGSGSGSYTATKTDTIASATTPTRPSSNPRWPTS